MDKINSGALLGDYCPPEPEEVAQYRKVSDPGELAASFSVFLYFFVSFLVLAFFFLFF